MTDTAGQPLAPSERTSAEGTRQQKSHGKVEISQSHLWFTAPVIAALLGLFGTGVGASLQGRANNMLERNKFEYELIQKALAAPNRPDAAKELEFYRTIGLLRGLNEDALAEASKGDAKDLPIFHGAALRDNMIRVEDAKLVLQYLTAQNIVKNPKGPIFYEGQIDDKFDLNFQIAVMRFQKETKLEVDGLLGPKTVFAMWNSCQQCPTLLKEPLIADNTAKK